MTAGTAQVLERTMVRAETDDGQDLVDLNEVYLGSPTHQSARYTLTVGGQVERQSSSGIIVGTGTGSTWWCLSLQQVQAPELALPGPGQQDLAWFVREPWPSPSSGALGDGTLRVRIESEALVAFGDGIEDDRLLLSWGQQVTIATADRRLATVQ